MSDKKRVAIGYENFKEIIDKNIYYVDKTMLIYDLIENHGMVNLIMRPRRFGKTLNFSMLKYFFDVTEKDNAYIFDGLKISEYYDELKDYRNSYPVISLSMKGGKMNTYAEAVGNLCQAIRDEYNRFRFLLQGDTLSDEQKEYYKQILSYSSNGSAIFNQSIKQLSIFLNAYYGRKAIILIDEYDVPLENSYFRGFYDEMVGFIRSLFESALKTNDALEFAVLTGCLRVSKESIFTGLNNLETNSILDEQYAEYFGFEEREVKELLHYFDLDEKFDIIKRWYDGYMFGEKEVYNPWSVINYAKKLTLNKKKLPELAWANSSSNNIIRKLVESADEDTKQKLELLMNSGSIETILNETITYGDLDSKQENMWNFLFFTGYLRVKSIREVNERPMYTLVIPNKEIWTCYEEIIMQYFEVYRKEVDRNAILNSLLSRDTDGFAAQISSLLNKSISFYDRTESFYHGLIAGLIARSPYYRMESNRETGDGRCDIALYQEDRFDKAIIIEIKICDKNENLEAGCRRALKQIDDKHYSAEAEQRGYKDIIKYGVAFKGKLCGAVCE